jgi:methylphosphotriester-DNA--protein-cysteine methyltransferase
MLRTINSNKGDSVVEGMFVGSTGSNKYHRPDCRFVDKIKNKIYFKSSEEARKNGKVPCKTCNPS